MNQSRRPKAAPPISKAEIRARAARFIDEWRDETDEQREAQTFWNDLFEVFGVRRRGAALFEATAQRYSSGNQGRIDVFMPGVFMGEAKSAGRIKAAYAQMVDYLAGGSIREAEMPRWLLASDFQNLEIYDWDKTEGRDEPVLRIKLDQLVNHIDDFAFIAGHTRPREERNLEEASVKAARRLAELQDELYPNFDAESADADEIEEERAVFMTRLLFLLYGDDVDGLWDKGLFYRFVDKFTDSEGRDLQGQLLALFHVLNTKPERRGPDLPEELAAFPYVNGGLFDGDFHVPAFNRGKRQALIDACRVNWKDISPAIFGSLYQGLATRQQRRGRGEHYTSEKNILKTLGPLFLDELEDQLQAAWFSTAALAALREHLGTIRVLDPACGCGNFLVVAYTRLADMERRILERQRTIEGETGRTLDAFTTINLNVTPDHFAGIEIGWWPAKIAETAMFLTQHRATQALETIGVPPSILPIAQAANIVHADALETDWSDVMPPTSRTYVAGNPPFLGHGTRTPEQAAQLRAVWRRKDISRLDYVTAWHAKSLEYFTDTDGRWALVSTSSVCQGDQVARLFDPIFEAGWRIRFAHRTFAWESEASGKAAVHCVIVGFDRMQSPAPRLFVYERPNGVATETVAATISPYLFDATPTTVKSQAQPISEDLEVAFFGAMPRDNGGLVVEAKDYTEVAGDPIAKKYLRPYPGSRELVRGLDRWCLWLEDLDPKDLASPVLRARIDIVRAARERSRAEETQRMAETPHLFGQRGVRYEQPYLCIPEVFSENYVRVPAAIVPSDTIASNKLFTVGNADGLAFGVVVSKAFWLWQHTVGGRLESRPSFGNTTTWNTFPLPKLTEDAKQGIVTAGVAVTAARAQYPAASLSELYKGGAMPLALVTAHRELDVAVNKALGLPAGASDLDIVARLLDLYAERRP